MRWSGSAGQDRLTAEVDMKKGTPQGLREQANNWTCNHFSITNHGEDVVTLLRNVADSIEKLGAADILDITYSKHIGLPETEITVTVYFTALE
jgi:hypothetical protein